MIFHGEFLTKIVWKHLLLLQLMVRWINKLLMLVAVATIVGHNTLPHHHHVEIEPATHHHEHGSTKPHHHHDQQKDESHHNIFSFAQLGEDFVPTKFQEVKFDLPILYLLTPVITIHFSRLRKQSKTHFGYYQEFPPPDSYSSHLFSRPPPVEC
jgi:hypothetical protein